MSVTFQKLVASKNVSKTFILSTQFFHISGVKLGHFIILRFFICNKDASLTAKLASILPNYFFQHTLLEEIRTLVS